MAAFAPPTSNAVSLLVPLSISSFADEAKDSNESKIEDVIAATFKPAAAAKAGGTLRADKPAVVTVPTPKPTASGRASWAFSSTSNPTQANGFSNVNLANPADCFKKSFSLASSRSPGK